MQTATEEKLYAHKFWENVPEHDESVRIAPFERREWTLNVSQGTFIQLDFQVEVIEANEQGQKPTVQIQTIGKAPQTYPKFTFNQVKLAYNCAAKEGISLYDAILKVVDMDDFTPKLLRAMTGAPKIYVMGDGTQAQGAQEAQLARPVARGSFKEK